MSNPLVHTIWGTPTTGLASPNSHGLGSPLMGGPTPGFSRAAGAAPAQQWFWRKSETTLTVPADADPPKRLAARGTNVVLVDIFPLLGNIDPVTIGGVNMSGLGGGASYQLDPGRCLHLWVDDFVTEFFDLGDWTCVSSTGTLTNILLITIWAPMLLKAK